jgi:hypothetical protein
MRIDKNTDTQTAKQQIGKLVHVYIAETGIKIEAVFIGFWHSEFNDNNSQIEKSPVYVPYQFNVLTKEKIRFAVDYFDTVDN